MQRSSRTGAIMCFLVKLALGAATGACISYPTASFADDADKLETVQKECTDGSGVLGLYKLRVTFHIRHKFDGNLCRSATIDSFETYHDLISGDPFLTLSQTWSRPGDYSGGQSSVTVTGGGLVRERLNVPIGEPIEFGEGRQVSCSVAYTATCPP